MKETEKSKKFTVVLRGPSAAIFRQGTNMLAVDYPSPVGPVQMVYTTRWLNRGPNITLPGHLWIEVSGLGNSLEDVLVPFANAGSAMLPLFSLSTNVAVEEPEIELGFEATEGAVERDYFQAYVPPESGLLHVCRQVNIETTVAVVRALSTHNQAERLRRGANQYRFALESWRLGHETFALAHLWMALEAITKAKIRAECAYKGLTSERELADHLGVPIKDLDPTVRKQLILDGDEECYSKAKEASDGFEHGYLHYSEINSKARDVRHRMAHYVRKAIIDIIDLPEETRRLLLSPPFDRPLGYWPLVKYFRGKLVGSGEQLAADGNAYPFLRWRPTVKSASSTDDGKFNMQITETITPELGAGISFQPGSFEAWQAE